MSEIPKQGRGKWLINVALKLFIENRTTFSVPKTNVNAEYTLNAETKKILIALPVIYVKLEFE